MSPRPPLTPRIAPRHSRGTLRAAVEPLESRIFLDAQHALADMSLSFWATPDSYLPQTACPGPIKATDFSSDPLDLASSLPIVLAADGLPVLNSLPSAPTAVYLDFDGDTSTSTDPYDEDGNPSTFNAAEQAHITEAWRQVSVYFVMFDTNVTTVKPSVPTAWDVTGNNAGGSTGGYAYVGTFPNSSPQAFTASSFARDRATGIAHEVGHVFGLGHISEYDLLANKTKEYAGETDPLHGPLMGVDYAGQIHKWFIGHSSSPSLLQDDIQVIANEIKPYQGTGGDGYRKDDFKGTILTATPLPASDSGQVISGIIERLNDTDAFSFVADGGTVHIAAVPDSPSGVDIKLSIYGPDQSLIAEKDSTGANDAQLTTTLPAGTYYAFVSSHGNYGDVGAYTLSVRSLAAGWASQDIGTTNQAGFAQFLSASNTFTVAGSGSDIEGTTDHFHFAYQTLTGDGEIVAKVASLQDTSFWAKGGLMIREKLTTDSKHVMMSATAQGGPQLVWRTSTQGTAVEYHETAAPFTPLWLKLVRSDYTFSAYISADGVDYTLWKSATVSMPPQVYIGLAVCSFDQAKLNTASFTDVAFAGNLGQDPPSYNALPAPSNLAVSTGTGTGLSLSWDAVDGATGYAVERSPDGVIYTRASTTAASVTTYADNALPGSARYFYRVSALNADGASPPSSPANAINRPSAPASLAITSYTTTSLILNWKDTSGETGYRIEQSTDGSTFTTHGTVGKNIPSYTDINLAAGTTYYYRLVATSSLGDAPPSAVANGSTRLSPVAGLAFESVASNRIVLHWHDMATETGYRIERSTDGDSYSTLATVGANVTTYTDSTVKPLTEYYYRVVGTKGAAESTDATPIFTATPPSTLLRSPWLSLDVGTVSGGASGYSAGTYTIIADGKDIWDKSDAFHFVYQPLVGDGQIVARVNTLENTDASAKVGVMIRETLAVGSKHAMVVVTPGSGVLMQYRSGTGGTTTSISGPASASAPYWVKIVRASNTLTGYASADGAAWTNIGSATVKMTSTVSIGFAATSHNTSQLNTSTVDRVALSNAAPTIAAGPSFSPDPVDSVNATLSVLGADDHGETNLTYSWVTTGVPDDAQLPEFLPNDSNDAKNTLVTFFQAGTYTFEVSISDSGGLSITRSLTVNVIQSLTAIDVRPDTVTVDAGATYPFTVAALDQFGLPISNPPEVAWTIVSGGGDISPSGLFTAPLSPQTTIIKAAIDSLSDTASVNIGLPAPAAPANLTANLLPNGALELHWQHSGPAPAGFRIQRSIDNLDFLTIGVTPGDLTTFTDTEPLNATAVYRVAAFNSSDVFGSDRLAFVTDYLADKETSISLDASGSNVQLVYGNVRTVTLPASDLTQIVVYTTSGQGLLTVVFNGDNPIPAGGLTFDTAVGNGLLSISAANYAQELSVSQTQVTFGGRTIAYSNAAVSLAHFASLGSLDLAGLSLAGGATLALAPGLDETLRIGSLSLANGATLDLADTPLAVTNADPAAIFNLVNSARADGTWAGPGITSSLLRSDPRHMTTLAVVPNNKGDGGLLNSNLDLKATLVKRTWNGDANIDGIVNADDYFLIDTGFITQTPGFYHGDFNYDNIINADDYFLIDSAFLAQTGPLADSSRSAALSDPSLVVHRSSASAALFSSSPRIPILDDFLSPAQPLG